MSTHPDQSGGTSSASFSTPAVQGFFFALAATVVWSFNFIAGRGLADAIPPCTLALARWGLAFCAVLPFALPELKREWRYFARNRTYYFFTGAIGIAWFNTALYIAAHSVPALNMSLMATSSPLFTIILARVFFGEPIPLSRVAGIIIVIFGILLLIARGDFQALAGLDFHKGDLLVLSAALSFSIYTLLVRKKPQGGGQLSYFAVTFGIGVLLLLPFAVWEMVRGEQIQVSAHLIGGIVYMGLGASLLAFWCWSRAINSIGPARSSLIYYSLPLFCAIEAVLMLGEPIHWFHYAGGALIVSGLALATRSNRSGAG